MATSVVFDLVTTLVSRFTAALPTVTVIDGDSMDDGGGNFLMVGWDDPDNDRGNSAEARQDWAGLGNRARDEEGTVTCLAVAYDGANSLATARTAVKAIADGVENNLRTDPNLGGVVAGLRWTGYGTRTELQQWLSDRGAVAMLTFEIAFKARL